MDWQISKIQDGGRPPYGKCSCPIRGNITANINEKQNCSLYTTYNGDMTH